MTIPVSTQKGRLMSVPIRLLAGAMLCIGATACTHMTHTAAKAFRDCSTCPEMVIVPTGRFLMGSAEDEPVRDKDEGPVREVIIARPFAVATTEVTRGQFAAFVAATGHVAANTCAVRVIEKTERLEGKSWRDPNIVQAATHPVVCVSWNDAKAYVAWLGSKTGKPYRLLSEAEWEYAARAGASTRYAFGDDSKDICRHGNVADASAKAAGMGAAWPYVECDDGFGRTTSPAGSFAANAFGLFDMYGNAWEWVEDCYRDSYRDAPVDGSPVIVPDCKVRIDRGGGWYTNRGTNRPAERASFPPGGASANIGFRVARDL
jgi:formylglycine-generating enzyme required for sulfatase activity